MPQANIWIRKEDWETWQAIGDKAEWMSNALNVAQKIPKMSDPTEVIRAYTCKNGHRSVDGKHCFNAKCVYA